jgi:hypothetical protein
MDHIRPRGATPAASTATDAAGANPAGDATPPQRARPRAGGASESPVARTASADAALPPRAAPLREQLDLPAAPGVLGRAVARTGMRDVIHGAAEALHHAVLPASALAAVGATLATVPGTARPAADTLVGILGNAAREATLWTGAAIAGGAAGIATAQGLRAARNALVQVQMDAIAGPLLDSGGVDRTSDVERLMEHIFTRADEDSLRSLRPALARAIAQPRLRAALADLAGSADADAAARAAQGLAAAPEFEQAMRAAMFTVHDLQSALDERAGMFGGQASLQEATYINTSNLLRQVNDAARLPAAAATAQLLLAIRRDAVDGTNRQVEALQVRTLDHYIEVADDLAARR